MQAGWASASVLSVLAMIGPATGQPVTLQERFVPDHQYTVTMRSELSGRLTPPATKDKPSPKPIDLRGDSAYEYVERILAVDAGQVTKTARLCRRMELQRTVAGQAQENKLRPAVRRLIIMRSKALKAPFSPDGPLLWSEIDLMRTDVFAPGLAGLLPGQPVRPGETWTAATASVQELTGLDRIEEGKVECKLDEVGTFERRRQARVLFNGTVKGETEDGPNRHQLQGYLLFDLESNLVSYIYLNGVQSLLNLEGKEVGRTEGRFLLRRELTAACPEIAAAGLRGVALEPNDDNTLLLYDNPNLGLRFQYPRRWRPQSVSGRQLMMDSADGHGILITLESAKNTPTGEQFLAESRRWLEDRKAKLLRVEPVREVLGMAGLEHFALEADMGGQKFLMDYHVLRQQNGGATLAARLLPGEQDSARREAARLARSLSITRRIEDEKKK